jgi:EmrB/QacA subfamily drug resistance transporter
MRAKLQDPEYIQRKRWLILTVLCVSLVVIVLDNTILNVALPSLQKAPSKGGLGASQSQLQWIVDSYTIVFAGLLLTAGSVGDRFGRYRFLATGLAVFGVGSVASAFATDANVLIATRSLMGVGGALIMPSTLSILTNVFTDHKERGKAIGIWAGVSALGLGIGPLSGGILLAHFWWGSVFLINVPFVILGLIFGYLLIPESKDESAPKLDPVGAVLSISGLATLLWAVIEAPSKGWTSIPVAAGFVAGVALLAGFFVWESRTDHPMLDLKFFKNPRFSAASGAITLTFLALYGVIFLLTQYLQIVLGYSTIKAGAVLVPQAIVIMIAAPLSNVWVQRIGNKVVVAAGLGIVGVSMFLFTTLGTSSTTIHVILVTMVLGLGMGNVMAPATDSIMGSLPRAKAGVGSAVNDTTRQVGGAIGVAVFGSILASQYGSTVRADLGSVLRGPQLGAVSDSIGRVREVIGSIAPGSRGRVVDAANNGFVHGMHTTAIVAGVILIVAMFGVIRFLPAHHLDEVAGGGAWDGEPSADSEPSTTTPSAPPGAHDPDHGRGQDRAHGEDRDGDRQGDRDRPVPVGTVD